VALDLGEARSVWLIGGGGKTSLLFALAAELVGRGERVVTTTTTRILVPEPSQSPLAVVEADEPELHRRLRVALSAHRHATAARALLPDGKLAGLAPEAVERLVATGLAERVLVEADGSAGRSLKAHAVHEPVVAASAELVVAVVGLDAVGASLDDVHVHRAALLAALLDRPLGAIITAQDVARAVLDPRGYRRAVPAGARFVVVLTKSDLAPAAATACAEALAAADRDGRVARVVVGSFVDGVAQLGVAWARD
jgi:probable selenium-dependent hydroxylase accessory protein YqeC